MKGNFGNIARLIHERWLESDPSLPVFSDGEGNDLSRNYFLRVAHCRQEDLADKITKGDKVMIAAGRGAAFFIDMFAVWSLGGVVVPYAADADKSHVEHLASISEAEVCLDDLFLDALQFQDPSKADKERQDGKPFFSDAKSDDLCAILFTSGSTGKPKGVMLSHYSLVNNSFGILEVLKFSGERLFVNIPFHFTSCICHFLACCFSGSTMIGVEQKMLFADFSKKASSVRANGIGGGPLQLKWLVDYAKSLSIKEREGLAFSGEFFISSGDRLSVEIIKESLAILPDLKIFTVYGLTELGGRFCVLEPSLIKSHMGSVGKPIEGLDIKIFDPDQDKEVGVGVEGEIVASGKLLSTGYFNDSKGTLASFRSFGFKTGDIGYVDEKGFVYVKGRTDDVFKVNGIKVSALLIVEALLKTEFFEDAAVIPIDIPVFGAVPIAFCVLKNSAEYNKGKVLKQLRSVLPNNHLPHEFILVDQIPRTGSGKVDRVKIKSIREP